MPNKPFEIETLRFNDGTIQTTAYTVPQQRGYFVEMTALNNSQRANGEAVVIDADNNTYVSYSYYDEMLSQGVGGVTKFNMLGEQQWSKQITPTVSNYGAQIVSLELIVTDVATTLLAIGSYYDRVADQDVGIMYFISTVDGTIVAGPSGEFRTAGGMGLNDAVAINAGAGVVVGGNTYDSTLAKTITPIAPSGVDRLYITWADFAANGLSAGAELIYNINTYYGAYMNSAQVTATPDGTGDGLGLDVSTTQAGAYVIRRSNGYSGAIDTWPVPITLRVLGSALGGVDGANDMTFDFDRTVFYSTGIEAAVSNIAGTTISDVFCTGFNGHDWGAGVLSQTALGGNGSANQLDITIADYPGITAVEEGWRINGPGIVNGTVTNTYLFNSDGQYMIDAGTAIAAGELYTFSFSTSYTLQYQLNDQAYIAQLGESSWAKNLGAQNTDRIRSVAADTEGNVYAVGQYQDSTSSKRGFVVKYNSVGVIQWAVHVDPSNHVGLRLFSVDVLPDGHIITVGRYGVVTKLNKTTGAIMWQIEIDSDISWDSDFKGTATPTGDYIFTNYEDDDYTLYVMRLSGADGSVTWTKRISRALGNVNGEIYPQDDFAAQYIDCNTAYVSIAATTYSNQNTNNDYAGLVITLPADGEQIDGVYGEYTISPVDITWTTQSTVSTPVVVVEQTVTVESGSFTPTSATSDITVIRTIVGDAVAAGANTGDITFSGVEIRGAVVDGFGLGAIKLVPNADNNYTNLGQFLNIYPTNNQDAPHIHIAAGTVNGNTGDLILGSDTYNLDVNHDGTVRINASGPYQWKFDATGALTLPSGGGPGGAGFVQTADGYPTLLAYGAGGHGGPELDWADTDNINSVFFDNTVLRHTMYLDNDGLYIGMNQNGKANVFSGAWNFGSDGVLKLPAGGDIVDSNTVSVLSGRYAPQSVPSSSPGRVGDKYGMIAVTTQWLYICTQDYTGNGANIWRRIAIDSDYTWTN